MATTLVCWSWKSHRQRSLEGCSPWGQKRVRHDSVTELELILFRVDVLIPLHEEDLSKKYYKFKEQLVIAQVGYNFLVSKLAPEEDPRTFLLLITLRL